MGGTTLGKGLLGMQALSSFSTTATSWSIFYAELMVVTGTGTVAPINKLSQNTKAPGTSPALLSEVNSFLRVRI